VSDPGSSDPSPGPAGASSSATGPSRRTSLPSRRRLLIDITPLRLDPQYRRLWIGQIISVMGNQVTQIALPYQVYVLTGSPLALALLTAVQVLPIFILSMFAGALADAFDRRKLLLLTQSSLAVTNVGLLVLALQEAPPIWAIYVLAGISGSILAVDWPTRVSAVPRLVATERIPAAIALNQLNWSTASIAGPAIGGLVLSQVGVAGAYATDLLAFGISIWAVVSLKPIAPLHMAAAPGLTAIREGLRYVRSRQIILSIFAIDLNATIFGRATGLFPILALDVFKTGAAGVGMLAAAPAVGALIGVLLSGWISAISRLGRAVIISVFVWGITITLFGLASFSFAVALVLLALAGAADLSSTVLRGTIVQTETPDQLRGRVTSIYVMSASSGPRLGDIRSTTLASVVGAQASVVLGGLACIVGAFVVARAFPELISHHLRIGGSSPTGGHHPAGVEGSTADQAYAGDVPPRSRPA
jgi:MFS family permease